MILLDILAFLFFGYLALLLAMFAFGPFIAAVHAHFTQLPLEEQIAKDRRAAGYDR